MKSWTNPDGGVYSYTYDKVHRLTGITTEYNISKETLRRWCNEFNVVLE